VVFGRCRSAPSAQHLLGADARASTGSVVDFRCQSWISDSPTPANVPLIGSETFGSTPYGFRMGMTNGRFITRSAATERFILPPDDYVVVKRFSPSEQRPRIRAFHLEREVVEPYGGVAFENHVNVISGVRRSLGPARARKILELLSSTDVDRQFRERSGSTQVNVSDLADLRIR
jgi:adenine-specific DNA-methyltransferase